jgi:uncharacterized protein YkwD
MTSSLIRMVLSMLLVCGCANDPTGPQPGAVVAADSVLDLTNAARADARVAPLVASAELDAVARAHARDMAERRYFSHTTPDGVTFTQRLTANGVAYRRAGENIAGNSSAAGAVAAWLGSSGHRANILSGGFGRLGVGIHREPDSPYTYYVQVFTD